MLGVRNEMGGNLDCWLLPDRKFAFLRQLRSPAVVRPDKTKLQHA